MSLSESIQSRHEKVHPRPVANCPRCIPPRKSETVEWIRRKQEGKLPAKELVG